MCAMYEELSEDVEKEIEQQLQLIDEASLIENLEEPNEDAQVESESTEAEDDWTAALDSQFGEYYSRLQTDLDSGSADSAGSAAPAAAQAGLPPGFLDQLEAEAAAEEEAEARAESEPAALVPPLDLASTAGGTPLPSAEEVDDGLRSGRSSIMTVRRLESSNPDKRIIQAWMETEEELIQLKTERWRLYSDLTKPSHRRKPSEEEKPPPPQASPQSNDEANNEAERLLAEEEKKQLESYEALLAEERRRTDELRQLSESVNAIRLQAAALTIQRHFRGYRIRNRIGDDIQRQLERARRKVFNEKVIRIEKERERLKALEHHRRRQEGESRLSSRASSRSSSRVNSASSTEASRPPQQQPEPLVEVPEEEEANDATVSASTNRGASTYVLPDQRFPPLTEVRDPNYTPGPMTDMSTTKTPAKKTPQKQQKSQKKKTEPKAATGDAADQKRPTSARAASRKAPPSSDKDSTSIENKDLVKSCSENSEKSVKKADLETNADKESHEVEDAHSRAVSDNKDSHKASNSEDLKNSETIKVKMVSNSESKDTIEVSCKDSTAFDNKDSSTSDNKDLLTIDSKSSSTVDNKVILSTENQESSTADNKASPTVDNKDLSTVDSKESSTNENKDYSSVGKRESSSAGQEKTVKEAEEDAIPTGTKELTAQENKDSLTDDHKTPVAEAPEPTSQLAPLNNSDSKATESSNLSPASDETAVIKREDSKADKMQSAESKPEVEAVDEDSVPTCSEPQPTLTTKPIPDDKETSAKRMHEVASGSIESKSPNKAISKAKKPASSSDQAAAKSDAEPAQPESKTVNAATFDSEPARERTTDHMSDLGQDLFIARLSWLKSQPTYAAVASAAAAAASAPSSALSPKRRPRRHQKAADEAAAEQLTPDEASAARARLLASSVDPDGAANGAEPGEAAALSLSSPSPSPPAGLLTDFLGRCVALRALRLSGCGLAQLPELAACCPQLQLLDVSKNSLPYIDVTGLDQLFYLDASSNRICSLHGLETAGKRLTHLDVSDNRLTRLDFGVVLPRLLHLNASRNQLTRASSSSLQLLPSAIWLNLRGNSIDALDSAGGLPCLVDLDLSENNLTLFPSLSNSPLLVRLNLAENSIKNWPAPAWLPCLRECSLSANQLGAESSSSGPLTSLLARCPLLRQLDLSANCLSTDDCLAAVASLTSLERPTGVELLRLSRNPGAGAALRRRLAELKPAENQRCLVELPTSTNDDIQLEEAAPPGSMFLRKCLEFSNQFAEREANYGGCHSAAPLLAQLRRCRRFYGDTFLMAKRHRCYQEFEHFLDAAKTDLLKYDSLEDSLGGEDACSALQSQPVPQSIPKSTPKLDESAAAVKIQAAYRGYSFRRKMDESLSRLELAAARIQATWRGHQVRQWIRAALATVKDESELGIDVGVLSGDEEMDEADIKIDEMDVDAMFDDIQLSNSPRLDSARRRAALPPKDAWINSPTSGGRFTPLGRLDLKGSLQVVTHRSDSTTGVGGGATEAGTGPEQSSVRNASQTSHRSKKIDQIREDWGFHDDRSAQVMLERAKKMKLNSDKRKRLSKMDPQQRYYLFKKLEASARPVLPASDHSKGQMHKIEYFKAKELERVQAEQSKREESGHKNERTYEWVFNSPVTEPPNSAAGNSERRPRSHELSLTGRQAAAQQQQQQQQQHFLPQINSGRSNSLISQASTAERAALSSAGTSASAHQGLATRQQQLPPIKRRK